jgi:hypothetical protein
MDPETMLDPEMSDLAASFAALALEPSIHHAGQLNRAACRAIFASLPTRRFLAVAGIARRAGRRAQIAGHQ